MMQENTKARTALITGASRGIGKAIALELAGRGMNIAIVYAGNTEAAQATVQEIRALGVQCEAYACDAADYDAVGAVCRRILSDLGPVWALINNAGVTRDKLAAQLTQQDIDTVIDVNLKGAIHFIRHTYTNFLRQRGGRIVNITSVVGLHGNAGQANYAASKAGLIGLTKSAAAELAPRSVTCNAIAPGFIDTDMTRALPESARTSLTERIPLKRLGSPEDVAQLAAFLCSDSAAYITGAVIPVDGGMGM